MMSALLLVLSLSSASSAIADNLERRLVGTWQGDVQFQGLRDGGFSALARYGTTGKQLRRVTIEIDTANDQVFLRFTTPAHTTVKLNLVSDNALTGTLTLRGAHSRGSDRRMRFEKVDSKPVGNDSR